MYSFSLFNKEIIINDMRLTTFKLYLSIGLLQWQIGPPSTYEDLEQEVFNLIKKTEEVNI